MCSDSASFSFAWHVSFQWCLDQGYSYCLLAIYRLVWLWLEGAGVPCLWRLLPRTECLEGRFRPPMRLQACNLSHLRARSCNTNIFISARQPCLHYSNVTDNRNTEMWVYLQWHYVFTTLFGSHRHIEGTLHTWSLLAESARPGALQTLKFLLFATFSSKMAWNTALLENGRRSTTLLLDKVKI